MSIFKRLFDYEYKEMKKFTLIADQIEAKKEEYEKLTDKQLQNKKNVESINNTICIFLYNKIIL